MIVWCALSRCGAAVSGVRHSHRIGIARRDYLTRVVEVVMHCLDPVNARNHFPYVSGTLLGWDLACQGYHAVVGRHMHVRAAGILTFMQHRADAGFKRYVFHIPRYVIISFFTGKLDVMSGVIEVMNGIVERILPRTSAVDIADCRRRRARNPGGRCCRR